MGGKEEDKVICGECQHRYRVSESLRSDHPFEAGEIVHGCPRCKSISCDLAVCEQPGCWAKVSCGTPTENGYWSTCGKHQP